MGNTCCQQWPNSWMISLVSPRIFLAMTCTMESLGPPRNLMVRWGKLKTCLKLFGLKIVNKKSVGVWVLHCLSPRKDYTASENDVIMLLKEVTSSPELSQQPLVFFPHDLLKLLSKPISSAPRNALAERACKELLA